MSFNINFYETSLGNVIEYGYVSETKLIKVYITMMSAGFYLSTNGLATKHVSHWFLACAGTSRVILSVCNIKIYVMVITLKTRLVMQ